MNICLQKKRSKEGIVSIYVNGDLKRERFYEVGPPVDQRKGFSWGIGKIHRNNFYAPLSGTIDEVRLYNRNLSEDDVMKLYSISS